MIPASVFTLEQQTSNSGYRALWREQVNSQKGQRSSLTLCWWTTSTRKCKCVLCLLWALLSPPMKQRWYSSICCESMKLNGVLQSTFKLWVEDPRHELSITIWGQILCHYLVLSISSSAAYRLWLAILMQLLSLSNTSYFHFCQTNITGDAGELERKDFCTVWNVCWKLEDKSWCSKWPSFLPRK